MESKRKLKFLCSYGGKILPRATDGLLRYVGGHTRVIAVHFSISFSELMVKVGEFCGSSMTLKCQLPNGDLETLISVKNDEDLANIIEVYDHASSSSAHPLKIRAILSPPKSMKKVTPPSSSQQSVDYSRSRSSRSSNSSAENLPYSVAYRLHRPVGNPIGFRNGLGQACCSNRQHEGSPRSIRVDRVPICVEPRIFESSCLCKAPVPVISC